MKIKLLGSKIDYALKAIDPTMQAGLEKDVNKLTKREILRKIIPIGKKAKKQLKHGQKKVKPIIITNNGAAGPPPPLGGGAPPPPPFFF